MKKITTDYKEIDTSLNHIRLLVKVIGHWPSVKELQNKKPHLTKNEFILLEILELRKKEVDNDYKEIIEKLEHRYT